MTMKFDEFEKHYVVSDEIITGRIYFSRVPRGGEREDFVAFLTRRAVENQIWINTDEQIRNSEARHKYSIDNRDTNALEEIYLPFEITDAKDTDECSRIVSGIWYRDKDFFIADWGSSGIPNVEKFLAQIIEHGLIWHVQLAIDSAHGYIPPEYADLDITANEFCKTLMCLPGQGSLPNGQFNIRKSGHDQSEVKELQG